MNDYGYAVAPEIQDNREEVDDGVLLNILDRQFSVTNSGIASVYSPLPGESVFIDQVDYAHFLERVSSRIVKKEIQPVIEVKVPNAESLNYYVFGSTCFLGVFKNGYLPKSQFWAPDCCVFRLRVGEGFKENLSTSPIEDSRVECSLFVSGAEAIAWTVETPPERTVSTVFLVFREEFLRYRLPDPQAPVLRAIRDARRSTNPYSHLISVMAGPLVTQIGRDMLRITPSEPAALLHAEALTLRLLQTAFFTAEGKYRRESDVVTITPSDAEKLHTAKVRLEEGFRENITIVELSRYAGINRRKLSEGFRLLYGQTVHEFLTSQRIRRATDLLAQGHRVGYVSTEVGYKEQGSFSRAFKKATGKSPKYFRPE